MVELDWIAAQRGPDPARHDVPRSAPVDPEDPGTHGSPSPAQHVAGEREFGLPVELGRATQVPRIEDGLLRQRDGVSDGTREQILLRPVDEVARSEDERFDTAHPRRHLREAMGDRDVVRPVLLPELSRLDGSLERRREMENGPGPERSDRPEVGRGQIGDHVIDAGRRLERKPQTIDRQDTGTSDCEKLEDLSRDDARATGYEYALPSQLRALSVIPQHGSLPVPPRYERAHRPPCAPRRRQPSEAPCRPF